jgi:Cd2+/Zn2+-exporting ATPase
LVIQGLHCADCAAKVEKTLTRLPGVTLAAVNFATSALSIEYDPAVLKRGEIGRAVGQLGYGVAQPAGPRAARGSVLRLTGLDCPDCAAKLEKSLRSRPGVKRADLNFAASKLVIEHSGPVEEVIAAVRAAGYGAELAAPGPTPVAWSPFSAADPKFVLTALSGVALLAGIIAGRTGLGRSGQAAIFAVALATGGYTVARAGLFSLRHLVLDMNVLVTIAALGAAAIDRWEEAATVVFLFSFGNLLEAYSLDRTRRSIRNLMQSAPQAAVVRREGREVTVPVEEVGEGETLIVRPGDRLAADGVVVAGASPVNQAMITGESLSVVKEKGAAVYAGTINEDGYLEVQVTAKAADSTLARIVHLVEEAQGQRAPTQQFVDTFARYYTPIVIGLAVAVAVLPSLVLRQPFTPWFYRSLALLVVSCPCALVVSTPVSIVSAIGNAARSGIMIKGGVHLEAIGKIRSIALDKTGTLTLGRPQVAGVVPASGRGEEEVLRAAAGVEARSEHALARAIVEAAGRQGIAPPAGENFVALPGRGAKAKVDGVNVYVGRPEFARDQLGLDLSGFREALEAARGKGRTAVVVGTKGFLLGLITFTDTPRPEAAAAVADLKRAGVRPVVMLTGDAEGAAALIGRRLGLDEVRAGLLPEDKVAAVRRLMADYGQVAMVGDGINDAPALAAASVGVAMGVVGSDAALETADIALMADDLTRVAYAVRLGRRTVATVRENIIFSLLVKVAALALIFPGWLTLWLAVMSDVGASLVVTLNGLRLLSFGGSRRAAQAAGPSPAEAIQTGS